MSFIYVDKSISKKSYKLQFIFAGDIHHIVGEIFSLIAKVKKQTNKNNNELDP